MTYAFNATARKALCLGLAVLLAAPLGALAGCAAYPSASDEAAVIGDERPPLEGRTAEQEAALAEEERATDPEELGYVPGQIVVVYEDDASKADREEALESLGAEEADETAEFETGDVTSLTIDEGKTVETAVREAKAEDAVKYAVPNYVVELFDEPVAETASAIEGDDLSTRQWYLDFVKAPAAWELLAEHGNVSEPVKVAVLDTGASLSHPDLENIIDGGESVEVVWSDSADTTSWSAAPLRGDGYTNGSKDITDQTSHGTHVSGIIAGEAGNGGILGVASGGTTANANRLVELVVIDTFSLLKNGRPNASLMDLVFALTYARDAGCAIVNMSLGFTTDDAKVVDLFENLCGELTENNDMLIVSAAGNSNATTKNYPAACGSVMGVISVSERRNVSSSSVTFLRPAWGGGSEEVLRSSFSNYGDWCEISAPGEAIYSTYLSGGSKNTYLNMQGTSMACPVVVGVAALVRAADPSLSAQEVREILCATADDLYKAGKDKQTGYGTVNAQAAVAAALGVPLPDLDEPAPTPSIEEAQITVEDATYSGSTQKPRVTVELEGEALEEGDDYVVRHGSSTPKQAGTYGITIEGHGDYVGTVEETFTISPASLEAADVSVKDQTYSGKALKPTPTVTVRNTLLKKGTDYTVTYRDNTNAGTATLTVKGKGNYAGTASTTFAIKGSSASKAPSAPANSSAPTAGGTTSKTPAPVVSPGPASGLKPTSPVNQAQSPSQVNKRNAQTSPTTVAKKDLGRASVSGIAGRYTYTGAAISPRPVLRYGSVTLREGVDYTVGYSKNRAVGTAIVTMTGVGAYRGTLQMPFSIVAPSVKATKISKVKAAKKAFKVTWKRATGNVSGYEVQYSTSKKFTKKTTKTLSVKASKAKTLSKSVKKLKAKKTYYVRVRTIYQVGDETFASSWSAPKKVKTKR